MKTTLREHLSILPEVIEHEDGTETDIPQRWWNWHREWDNQLSGYSYRVIVGDLNVDAEHDGGEVMGFKFAIELDLFENTGQFDTERYFTSEIKTRIHFQDHSFSFIFGRWGVYIAWRGRKIR